MHNRGFRGHVALFSGSENDLLYAFKSKVVQNRELKSWGTVYLVYYRINDEMWMYRIGNKELYVYSDILQALNILDDPKVYVEEKKITKLRVVK